MSHNYELIFIVGEHCNVADKVFEQELEFIKRAGKVIET